jgi:NAD(P)H-hydrate epimerase
VIEDFMSQFKGILVLKTVPVCVVKNRVGSINISGNQGLATAGTGDVLAGCIGGLISQGIPLFEAAKLGVFVHGKSADFILDQTGFRGMTAMRVLEGIPGVIKSYEFK